MKLNPFRSTAQPAVNGNGNGNGHGDVAIVTETHEAEFQKLKTRIHRELIDSLDLSRIAEMSDEQLRSDIRSQLATLWAPHGRRLKAPLQKWAAAGSAGGQPAIEDVAWPLRQLAESTDADIAAAWTDMKRQWTTTRKARQQADAEKFLSQTDFSDPALPAGWITEEDLAASQAEPEAEETTESAEEQPRLPENARILT